MEGAASASASALDGCQVVVCGGGIIGAASAFFLTQTGVRVTVVERAGVANAASGKAGGFLARGWGDHLTSELHEKGFALHETLAEELGLKSFRHLPTFSVRGGGKRRSTDKDTPAWLDGNVAQCRPMDPDTAQARVTSGLKGGKGCVNPLTFPSHSASLSNHSTCSCTLPYHARPRSNTKWVAVWG